VLIYLIFLFFSKKVKKISLNPFSSSKRVLFLCRCGTGAKFTRLRFVTRNISSAANEMRPLLRPRWTIKKSFPGGFDVMKLKPLNDRVLVKRLESEEKTAGGLYIPDTAKEKPSKGQVVAAGPGKTGENGERVALAVKAGDMVLFNKYAGTEVKLDGVDHLVMREEDILAIID